MLFVTLSNTSWSGHADQSLYTSAGSLFIPTDYLSDSLHIVCGPVIVCVVVQRHCYVHLTCHIAAEFITV